MCIRDRYTEGYHVPAGETYVAVEAPKENLVYFSCLMEATNLTDVKFELQDLPICRGLILWLKVIS